MRSISYSHFYCQILSQFQGYLKHPKFFTARWTFLGHIKKVHLRVENFKKKFSFGITFFMPNFRSIFNVSFWGSNFFWGSKKFTLVQNMKKNFVVKCELFWHKLSCFHVQFQDHMFCRISGSFLIAVFEGQNGL